jgi:hypothetical protein
MIKKYCDLKGRETWSLIVERIEITKYLKIKAVRNICGLNEDRVSNLSYCIRKKFVVYRSLLLGYRNPRGHDGLDMWLR